MADISKITPLGSSTTYNLKDNNAPRKDGTGATGTWGINISGSAALNVLKAGDTMTGGLTLKNGARWPYMLLQTTNSTNPCAEIIWDGANSDNNIAASRFLFREFSYNGTTASATALTNYEDFRLPSCTTNRTTNTTYDILTTKNTITIAQGGTGKTTALEGITNLGGIYWGGRGNEIAANTDLNTLNETNSKLGTYYSPSSTRSATLTNPPVTGSGFKLLSLGGYGTTRGEQIALVANSGLPYVRYETGTAGTWGDWLQLASKTDVSTKVAKAGDTMSGNLIVSKTGDTYVEAKNTTTGCRIEIDVNDAGKHGIWSSGYYANSTYTASSKWIYYRGTDGEAHSDVKIYGAVWNDYAEYRITKNKIEPGRCVIETGNDDLILSTKRMQPGAEIVSDTFGFAIGETKEAKTPIASNGRVLAYPYEALEEFKKNIGRPVCSGPNGTISIMTDEEYQKYGYCAIGTISAIPDYEEWGTGKVKVNGRVWIRIR